MSDTLPELADSQTGELVQDPNAYMAVVLHRAKGWLAEAQSIDLVRDQKAIAVGYEAVIREKELGMDAELAATEIVRRCERRIGQLVREGQERGEIRRQGQGRGVTHELPSPTDFASHDELLGNGAGIYHMTDSVSDDDFDRAIDEAKAERNLSRANVVRKVKGEPKAADRSEWHHKKRHIDSNRIVEQLALDLQGAAIGLDLVNPADLDPLRKVEWIESIQQSIRTIQKEMRKW